MNTRASAVAALVAALLGSCSSPSPKPSDPPPAPSGEVFTFRVTGLKGQPGRISDD